MTELAFIFGLVACLIGFAAGFCLGKFWRLGDIRHAEAHLRLFGQEARADSIEATDTLESYRLLGMSQAYGIAVDWLEDIK